MKRFFLVVMILASAASLYAAELKVSGDMNVRGIMDGFDGDSYPDAKTQMYFDYDLTIDAAFVANENATVFTKFAFDRTVSSVGYVDYDQDPFFGGEQNVAIERAYLNYKFFPFLQLNTGLMAGGQWATTFGDKEVNVMRVQFIGALSEDMIFIFTYQKDNEVALDAADVTKNEKDDQTTYYLSSIMKFGGIKVLPLLTYVQKGSGYTTATTLDDFDISVLVFTLGATGDFGMVGFEFEGAYKYTMFDDMGGLDDAAAYGAYINVFANIAPAKVGIAAAYASADTDAGTVYEMGDDFDFTIVADDLVLGNTYNGTTIPYGGLMGMTAFKLYGEVKAMEKLTAGAAFAYGMSTNTDVSDITFWEIDANATWAFDANASYTIAGGYANMSITNIVTDVETVNKQYRVYHKFNIKF